MTRKPGDDKATGTAKQNAAKVAPASKEDKIVNLAVRNLVPQVNKTFADILNNTAAENSLNQQLARLILKHREAMVASGSNMNLSWTAMVSDTRELTEAGITYRDQVIADFLPKVSSPPKTDMSKESADKYREYRNKNMAIQRAFKLTVAHGYCGGSSDDWDEVKGVLISSAEIIRPVQAKTTPEAQRWRFWYGAGGKQSLDGSAWRMTRTDEQGKEQPLSGLWSVSAVVTRFFTKPAHLSITSQTGEAGDKGADENRTDLIDPVVRRKVLATVDFYSALTIAKSRMDGDKQASITLAEFDGHPEALDAVRSFAMLYAKLRTEMAARTASANAAVPPKSTAKAASK